jgi:HK97 gp10 family phage protein
LARQRTVLRSNFRAAREAGKDAVADAIKKATDEMHEEAARRLDNAAGARGYNLYSTDIDHETSDDDGTIVYKQWYGKFFEYGTPMIAAIPFMRPAHRKGRAKLIDELDDNFEKWVRRRAGM